MISQFTPYNLSIAYNFSGVIDRIDQRLMQSQRAAIVQSSLTLDSALNSYSNFGQQVSSYLALVNQLSGLKCFWGNISLCNSCQSCTSLNEQLDFTLKHNELIGIENSIVAINRAIQANAAATIEFVQSAQLDRTLLQNFRMEVASQVQQSSESVRSAAASMRNQWQCAGANNALPDHHIFKSMMCDINSISANSIIQISCTCCKSFLSFIISFMPTLGLTFAIRALFFQWISMIFLFLGGHFLLSASEFGGRMNQGGGEKALNDISLSTSFMPAEPSITAAVYENGPTLMNPSKRFVPLSAPARASGASSL
jgi:hypothetical protein